MSRAPAVSWTWRNACATASSSVWSHAIAVMLSPRVAWVTVRPVANTLAPACASPIATPRPTPRLAPVTRATCPDNEATAPPHRAPPRPHVVPDLAGEYYAHL